MSEANNKPRVSYFNKYTTELHIGKLSDDDIAMVELTEYQAALDRAEKAEKALAVREAEHHGKIYGEALDEIHTLKARIAELTKTKDENLDAFQNLTLMANKKIVEQVDELEKRSNELQSKDARIAELEDKIKELETYNSNCISRLLHESRMEAAEARIAELENLLTTTTDERDNLCITINELTENSIKLINSHNDEKASYEAHVDKLEKANAELKAGLEWYANPLTYLGNIIPNADIEEITPKRGPTYPAGGKLARETLARVAEMGKIK